MDSRNYAALQILEPNPELEVIPVPSKFEFFRHERSCIAVVDIANILCETALSANWTILRDVLTISLEEWETISRQSNQQPLMDVFQLALGIWISQTGTQRTVGLLYDSLAIHGHLMSAGSLLIYNIVFNRFRWN
jgi:hypothetical protein